MTATPDTHSPASPRDDEPVQLERGLSNRHIQLIAIGGAIGTGLFLGSGIGIHKAGPSILLVYAVVGFMLFFMMRAMGELLLSNLQYRTFQDFAADYLGPWARYFMGWTYWLCLLSMATADVVGIQAYAQFWWPGLPGWIPMTIAILLVLGLNLIAVRAFGEAEFWFALIKVITILALIVVGVVLIVTAFQGPTGNVARVSHLWDDGGFFPTGFIGFLAGFQIAIFAFVGIELVGTTAAEAKDPERNLPKAINQVPIRILFFYVLALGVIICVTPWSQIQEDKSPFVALFGLIGFAGAAGIINFVVLTSATSAANSGIFSSSRMVYGLATTRQAASVFARLTRNRVPGASLVLSCVVLFLGGLAGMVFENAFELVTTVSSILFIFVWSMIMASYLVYRRRRPDPHAASTYKMPGGVVMCWIVLAFFAAMLVVLGIFEDTRIALLCSPVWFVGLAIAYRLRRGPTISESDREAETVAERKAVAEGRSDTGR